MKNKEKVKLPNLKRPAVIMDMDKSEVLVIADLTPASIKRFIKQYAQYGINARAVWNNTIEVKA